MSVVYFIRRDDGLVKIGFTGVFRSRMRTLIGEYGHLELLGLEKGARQQEAKLHSTYQQWRREGEWFEFASDLREYVSELDEECADIAARWPHELNRAALTKQRTAKAANPNDRQTVRNLLSPFDAESWMLEAYNRPVPGMPGDTTWEVRAELYAAVRAHAALVAGPTGVKACDTAVTDMAFLCAALISEQSKGHGPGSVSYLARISMVGLLEVWRTTGNLDANQVEQRAHKYLDTLLREFGQTRIGEPDWAEEVTEDA